MTVQREYGRAEWASTHGVQIGLSLMGYDAESYYLKVTAFCVMGSDPRSRMFYSHDVRLEMNSSMTIGQAADQAIELLHRNIEALSRGEVPPSLLRN